jgi:hypothetical protein
MAARKDGAMSIKPTLPEIAPLIREIYGSHPGGCCWHIVLDDGNVEDGHVRWVVDEWLSRPESAERCKTRQACMKLGELLPRMSRTQRSKMVRYAFASDPTRPPPHGDGTDEDG